MATCDFAPGTPPTHAPLRFPSLSCCRSCRSAFDARVSARPRISITLCLLASLPFSFTYFLLSCFLSFSLTVLHIRFSLYLISSFSFTATFCLSNFLLSLRIILFAFFSFTRLALFLLVTFFAIKHTSLSLLFYFNLSFHVCLWFITRQELRARINYFRIFGASMMRERGRKRTGCSPDPAHPRSHKWSFVMTSESLGTRGISGIASRLHTY